VIRAEPVMPPAVQQRFLATAAGMPGGLALIPAQVTMARPQTAA
jgi:hypothetical protein